MKHLCHADGCRREVSPSMLCCNQHWRAVPKVLQRQLWATYTPGQEDAKNPSPAYLVASERCIVAIALAEGRITEDEAAERIAARERDAEAMAEALPIAKQLGLI